MSEINERLDSLRGLVQSQEFLEGKGLSNEVNIRIFCYDPKDEMAVRHFTEKLVTDQSLSCHLIEYNLYKVFLSICDDKRITDRIPGQEEKKGKQFILDQMTRMANNVAFIGKMQYEPHEPGDVILITGVGEAFPFIRVHSLLDAMNFAERKKAVTLLSERYRRWEQDCEYRFSELKKNEEELNSIFIDIYGLQDELTPTVEDKDVTVRKADLQRDIRSLISYAVGCMFGRYSLDAPGLAFAGGTWDASKYTTFQPDKDAIIPICDDEYFEDDIVGRFVKFIEVVYGKDTLEENLQFIAQALGGRGTSREVIRNYFINDFYADHVKIYQKRPIYWLFDSGKKNGFKCLVYMHRYQPDTIARIRTDYVHEQQSRYRTAIADLEQRINGASTSERVKLNKQLSTLQGQADEIRVYEEKIHHLADQMIKIDLDDGVKNNYEIFKDVLAKIK